jgi:putative peptide zinc metalloprotease protein
MSSQCERLASELESLRQRRNSSPEASSRIPVVEKALEEAVKQKRVRENVAAQLTLASPRSGRIFAPPQRPPQTTDDRYPRFWTGTPLEPLNRGAWLGEGTVLCIVGDTTMREAILMLRQQDVELIVPNQPVKLLLADTIRGAVTGRVLEVAASPSEEIPAELQRSGRVNPSAGSDKAPLYQVRVSLDRTSAPLPVRLTGHAQVSVSSASILARIARFLSDSFG